MTAVQVVVQLKLMGGGLTLWDRQPGSYWIKVVGVLQHPWPGDPGGQEAEGAGSGGAEGDGLVPAVALGRGRGEGGGRSYMDTCTGAH